MTSSSAIVCRRFFAQISGRAVFSGRVREPFYAYVGNGRQRVHFILEPGTAKVDIDGTDVKLSDYVGRGRYILLDHWASWCGPCKAEMPSIKKTCLGTRFWMRSGFLSSSMA